MMKVKTHHLGVVILSLLCLPLFAAAWITFKYLPSWDYFRPWLLFSAYTKLPENDWHLSWQIGAIGSMAIGALLLWMFEGAIFGVQSSDLHGSAKWATPADIKDASLMQTWGATIGRIGTKKGSQILRTNAADYSNILVSAPPRAGKGAGIIIPTLLEYPGSVMVYDVKGENYEHTARHRMKMGDQIKVFSPFDTRLECGHNIIGKSHRFNPLWVIKQNPDIEERLTAIGIMAGALLSPNNDKEKGLLATGREIFVAVCCIVCEEEDNPTLGRVVDLLTPSATSEGEVADLQRHFSQLALRAPEHVSEQALSAASANKNENIALYLSVLFDSGLKAWRNPSIRRATEAHDFDFDKMRSEPQSIYIVIPTPYKDVAQPVVRLFFQLALKTLQMHRPNLEKEPLDVLFIIDEFHSLGYMKEVLDAPTVIAGYGGRIMTVVQAPASLDQIYGKDAARIFLDVSQLKVFMSPNDNQTRRMVEESIGYRTMVSRSVSGKTIGSGDKNSTSYSEIKRPLMSADDVGRMPKTKQVITVQGRNAIFADRIRYFDDPHYQKIHAAQEFLEWPTHSIPVIKEDIITRKEDFLAMPGEQRPSATSVAKPQPEPTKPVAETSNAEEGQKSEDAQKPVSVVETPKVDENQQSEGVQKAEPKPPAVAANKAVSPSVAAIVDAVDGLPTKHTSNLDSGDQSDEQKDAARDGKRESGIEAMYGSNSHEDNVKATDELLKEITIGLGTEFATLANVDRLQSGTEDDTEAARNIRDITSVDIRLALSEIPQEAFENTPLTAAEHERMKAVSA